MKRNLEETASLWLIEQKEGLSEKRQKEFDKWLKDDLNRKTYKELETVEKNISLMDEDLKLRLRDKVKQELEEPKTFSLKPFLLAASILLIACVSIFINNSFPKVLHKKIYLSEYKVQKDLVLPDNTQISLDAKSKIEVTYYDDKREVSFFKGRVMFDVAKDKKRPFIIYTKKNTIEVLGTSFEVSLKDKITTVKVKEGTVKIGKIYNEEKDSQILSILKKEDSISLNEYGKIKDTKKIPIKQIAIWQDENINFNDTPLDQAVEEFLKYTDKKVYIDKNIKAIEVTGTFKTNELERFINSLSLVYPIKIEKKDSLFYIKEKL